MADASRPAGVSRAAPAAVPPKETWREALFNRRMLICVFVGFSSGLPLYLLINLLPAWLRTEGVDLKAIGLFALIGLPYTWKFLWSPLLDRYAMPWLGRRRGWMFAMHIALLISISALGYLDPKVEIWTIAYLAAAVAFFSASLDIALDAFRRELLPEPELGLGNSIYVNAYRISSLVPGSLALILADRMPWSSVFFITALFMLPGLVMTLVVSEPAATAAAPKTLRDAVILPFREFVDRSGWSSALLVVAFIFLYKLGDSMATALATPFYLDMGFTKTQIGIVAKNAGLWASVIGGMLGGLWMVKIGINKGLWLFGWVQMFSILGFAWLAWLGRAERRRAGRGHRVRGAGDRSRYRSLRCVHRTGDGPALHRDAIRVVHQPVGGPAHDHQRHDRLDCGANGLVQLFPVVYVARGARNGITLACCTMA